MWWCRLSFWCRIIAVCATKDYYKSKGISGSVTYHNHILSVSVPPTANKNSPLSYSQSEMYAVHGTSHWPRSWHSQVTPHCAEFVSCWSVYLSLVLIAMWARKQQVGCLKASLDRNLIFINMGPEAMLWWHNQYIHLWWHKCQYIIKKIKTCGVIITHDMRKILLQINGTVSFGFNWLFCLQKLMTSVVTLTVNWIMKDVCHMN